MDYLTVTAAPLLAHAATLRPVATRIALGFRAPGTALAARAGELAPDLPVGRVCTAGAWEDAAVHAALSDALEAPLRPALRRGFEWHLCRSAFFHTDAHYGDVLFGVWCAAGPAMELVFPRAGVRLRSEPGTIAIFDPFEVHGVLHAGVREYRTEDYAGTAISAFVGFELTIDDAVRECFGITRIPQDSAPDARIVSSGTRVAATTGAFE